MAKKQVKPSAVVDEPKVKHEPHKGPCCRSKFKVEAVMETAVSLTSVPCTENTKAFGSPAAVCSMYLNIHNKDVLKHFAVGEEFVVDFTKVTKE